MPSPDPHHGLLTTAQITAGLDLATLALTLSKRSTDDLRATIADLAGICVLLFCHIFTPSHLILYFGK